MTAIFVTLAGLCVARILWLQNQINQKFHAINVANNALLQEFCTRQNIINQVFADKLGMTVVNGTKEKTT